MAQEDITTQLFADILPKTPAQEQATYQAQRDLMALKMAQLPAGAGVRFAGFQASQDLGRALGGVEKGLRQGLFGIETSKEAEDRISKEIRAGGADILKTEGLDGYLNYLSDAYGQAGLTDKATKARLVAEKLTQQQELIKSTITKNLAAANKDKQASTLDQARNIVLQLSGRSDLNPEEKRILENANKVLKLASPGQTIDLGAAFEKAFAAKDATGQAEAWTQAGQAYNTAKPILRQINEVERILPNAFTGKFAEGKLGLSKALGAVGIPISDRASDTEYINAISARFVQQIARAFPGSLAVKELDQLVKSKPNISQEAGTILKLVGEIRDEITSQVLTYEKLSGLPQRERYSTNANIVQSQFGDKIAKLRTIQRKAAEGRASIEEAKEGLSIEKELGIK
jgi:hypothetical protein